MRIGILGPLRVTSDDGVDVEVSGARLRALLTRLALEPGRQVTISTLTDTLWNGDAQPSDPSNAVQSLVSRLRRAVPKLPITSGPGGYRLDLPPESVDAHLFEILAASGRKALNQDPHGAVKHLRAALDLWRGHALADLAPAHPAAATRLEELKLAAIEDRIDAELQTRTIEGRVVAELGELVTDHPLRERLAALYITALAAVGRQAAALSAYEEIRRRLADELGADPSGELREAHLKVLRGEAQKPAQEPQRALMGNLRAALTTFVGRDEEIEQVIKQLGENRLVTLVGPGGAGKTRLASVSAAQFAMASSSLAGGVWLVELAPVTDPGDVPRAVLDSVGRDARPETPKPGPPRDTMARLTELIEPFDTLLVLDNCEHVIEAAARLADDLLAGCPGLRVLATSREPLAIVGEVLMPVPPLRLPTVDAAPSEALEFAAVQLLADRAAAVRPGFSVTDENVHAVVEICRRLDGLPLAIELAAARLRALSPAQVADRLDDRFRLLTGGSRTALPRHRTLRAVVAWSWDLLTDNERKLAEYLAVFPSTVTPESAAGVSDLDDAAEVLDALVDKSLLQVVGDGRFRMLETIREFGLERLAEAGAVADAQRAHTAYFLRLLREADPYTRTAAQLPWLRLIDAERENLYGAMSFACDAGDSDSAIRLGALLMFPLAVRDDFRQTAPLLDRALALPGPSRSGARAVVRAMTMISHVFAGIGMPDPEAVATLLEEARHADPADSPFVLLIEPLLTIFTDDTASGLAAVQRGFDAEPDAWTCAMLHMLRGQIEENDGDAEGSMRDQNTAAGLFRRSGDRWGLSICLAQLADALTKRGEYDAAATALNESLALARQVNAQADAWYQQMWLAALRARRGDLAGARADLTRLLDEVDDDRDSQSSVWALLMLGDLARQAGDLDEAEAHYASAWSRNEIAVTAPPQFRALLKGADAYLALARGEPDRAREHLVTAMKYALDGRDMPVVAQTAVVTASYWAAVGSPERAAEVLGAADNIRGHPDRSNVDAERLASVVREAVGEAAFEAAYSRGRMCSRVDALARVNPAAAAG